MYQKIHRSLEYALMALQYMSDKKDERVSVREMSDYLHCPFDPFSKVMQKMAEAKIIHSKKGVGGGYCFSGNLKDISVYELMFAVLPSTEIADCLSGSCQLLNFCNIKKPILNLNQQLNDFYKGISVESLFQKKIIEKQRIAK